MSSEVNAIYCMQHEPKCYCFSEINDETSELRVEVFDKTLPVEGVWQLLN